MEVKRGSVKTLDFSFPMLKEVELHILLGILTVLGAAAFWYYRMKYIGEAASEVVDAAGKLRGAYNRRKFRKKVEGSVLTAIDDPVSAAAVMMTSMAMERGGISDKAEQLIRANIAEISGSGDTEEPYVFAKWTSEQVIDANDVSLKLAKLWTGSLTEDERRQFLGMVEEIATCDGPPEPNQQDALRRLAQRLALAP